jgi:hypothetical protein
MSRICITDDDAFNLNILIEHEKYKGTGSIEAQAHIDAYILPCLMRMYYCKAKEKQKGDGRTIVPSSAWEILAGTPTPVQHVIQYATLPDLGLFIRERIVSTSILVPTYVTSSASSSSSSSTIHAEHNHMQSCSSDISKGAVQHSKDNIGVGKTCRKKESVTKHKGLGTTNIPPSSDTLHQQQQSKDEQDILDFDLFHAEETECMQNAQVHTAPMKHPPAPEKGIINNVTGFMHTCCSSASTSYLLRTCLEGNMNFGKGHEDLQGNADMHVDTALPMYSTSLPTCRYEPVFQAEFEAMHENRLHVWKQENVYGNKNHAHMNNVGSLQGSLSVASRGTNSLGCLHGSYIALMFGAVLPIYNRRVSGNMVHQVSGKQYHQDGLIASQFKKIRATSTHYRSAVACCSAHEFSVVCMLLHGLLLGLYPRGSRTAIFDVRVRLVASLRELMTHGNQHILGRQRFLMQNSSLIQLAFLEYANNFLPDYMPCEAQLLGMLHNNNTSKIVVHYTSMCDQFRERTISVGNESWSQLNHGASAQLDKLMRNSNVNHATNALRNCQAKPSQDRNSAVHVQGLSMSMGINARSHSINFHLYNSQNANNHCQIIRVPKVPLPECMYDMHLCMTNNLQELYAFHPEIQQHKHLVGHVHILHKRLHIAWLPSSLANEQRQVLERTYESCVIQQTCAKTLYVCTSCAIAGKPVPLRPSMRYNCEKKQFYCLTCHPNHPTSSIVAIDMLGKVLHTSRDMPMASWRCYIFCVKCARVHEWQVCNVPCLYSLLPVYTFLCIFACLCFSLKSKV